MANPFKTKFKSTCQSYGEIVEEGDDMFAIDGQFVCEQCAEAGDNICECGNFKKEEYDTCFDCHEENSDMEGDSVNIY
jgi:hypothetical protein